MAKHGGKWEFGGDGKAVFSSKDFADGAAKYTYTIDGSKSPKAINLTLTERGEKQFGIYKIEKGTLTLCLTGPPDATADDRPKEFAIKGKAGIMLEMERPAKK